jgi:hypothetical protein
MADREAVDIGECAWRDRSFRPRFADVRLPHSSRKVATVAAGVVRQISRPGAVEPPAWGRLSGCDPLARTRMCGRLEPHQGAPGSLVGTAAPCTKGAGSG